MRIYGFPVVEHRAPSLTPCLFPSKSPSAPLRSAAERLPHLLRFSSGSEVRGLAGLNTEQRAYHCLAGCKRPINIGVWGWVTDCFTQDWLAPVGKKIVKFFLGKINIWQDLKGILMTFKTLLSVLSGSLMGLSHSGGRIPKPADSLGSPNLSGKTIQSTACFRPKCHFGLEPHPCQISRRAWRVCLLAKEKLVVLARAGVNHSPV